MNPAATCKARTIIGIALICGALALQPTLLTESLERFYEQYSASGSLLRSFAILATYALALVAVISTSFAPAAVKWPLFIAFSISMVTNTIFHSASQMTMGYMDWVTLWRARADVGNAANQYSTAALQAIAELAPLLLGFLLISASRKRIWPWPLATVTLSVALFATVCIAKQGRATERLPTVTNLYGMMVASIFDRAPRPYRYVTDQRPDGRPAVDHLALVVDEGTRHDFFAHIVLPEIRRQKSAWHVYDFGAATSMADCSSETNIMLRKLVRFDDIPLQLYGNPLVWSLAHNAGLTTWLLDAQHHGNGHDFFDETERSLIDHLPEVGTGHDTDLVNHLMEAWSASPSFTYVIKRGTHFPYSQEYPESYRTPSPARLVPYVQANEMRIQAADSVDYQTGQFFRKLLDTSPTSRVAIFYTADHGLNIGDGPGTDHCNSASTSRVEVGMVPLLVLTNFQSDALAEAARRNRNLMSQFELVATVRNFLGYGTEKTAASGLFRTVQEPIPGFIYGSAFGLFGSQVDITPVDRAGYQKLERQRWPEPAH